MATVWEICHHLRRRASAYIGLMEQRISLVTLGVTDVTRSRAFYDALGWDGQEIEATVFFQVGCLALVLWGHDKLAADAGLDDAGTNVGFRGVALAHNVETQAEVDEIMSVAARAGATITSPASPTLYGGYAGYFADPDGHLWEIAHNPGFALDDDGSLVLPDFSQG